MRQTVSRILVESFPLLVATLILQVMGGQFLLHIEDVIAILPGVLAIVPVMHGVAGNVGSTLAARFGSNLHLGLARPHWSDELLRADVVRSLLLGLASLLGVGLITGAVLPALGLVPTGQLGPLMLVYAIAGTLATLYAVITAVVVGIWSFRGGLDPDNFSAPVVTSTTDLVGTIAIFALVHLAVV